MSTNPRIFRPAGRASHLAAAPLTAPSSGALGGELSTPQERFDRAREQGFEAGYRQGMALGQQEGARARDALEAQRKADAARAATIIARLEEATAGLSAARQEQATALGQTLLEAAFAVAEAVLGHALPAEHERARHSLEQALAVTAARTLTVRVNPADINLIGEALAPGRTLDVIADPAVAPGDCVVDAGQTTVEVRVVDAFSRAREAFISGADQ